MGHRDHSVEACAWPPSTAPAVTSKRSDRRRLIAAPCGGSASMYQTETLLRRTLRVHYPEGKGRMALRCELDWDRDVKVIGVSNEGNTTTFALEAKKPFLYFKPVLKTTAENE